jgi:hypothetical protein
MSNTSVHVGAEAENVVPDDLGGLANPDAVVAVYVTEDALTGAIKHLEHAGYDMAMISVLGRGTSEERHVVGFETPRTRSARWASWGGLWGWVFGAFVFVPGIGHVAIGGYLLASLIAAGVGAAGGALAGSLTSMGIPKEGIPIYKADLKAEKFLVIAHGTPADVTRARELLGQTAPERLDHHAAPASPVTGPDAR